MSTDKLPDGWTRVKFGDVVRKVSDRVDPETAGIERYVAGEHMDTDDLSIRRWGDVGDGYLGPAFHMRFKPGQVLYGSRRTYLRKVAVADFEGICANTTFVLEPSSKDLLPEFLPLVMTTEAFHDHSIKQSKGSVNPYINFSDLTWYEFALPPIDEQQRIVDVIGAVDQMVDARLLVRAKLEPLKRSVFSASLRGDQGEQSLAWGTVSSSVMVQCLGNLCTVTRGASPRPKGNPAYFARGSTAHHWIMISDVTRSKVGKVLTDTAEFLTDEGVTKSRKVSPGSLLLTNCATVGVPVFSGVHGCIHDGFLLFEDLSPELNVDYLYRLFEFLTPWFRSSAQTGTQANLNTEILRRLEVPMLPLSVQAEVVNRLDRIDEMSVSVDDSLDDLKRVRSALLGSLLVRGSHVQ